MMVLGPLKDLENYAPEGQYQYDSISLEGLERIPLEGPECNF